MTTAAEKVTHTPGPWNVSDSRMPSTVVYSSQGRIATCEGRDAQANARLIAAAPRLEEFLRYGVCGFCPSCGCNVGNTAGCDWCNWIQNGRALLAEINGEIYQRPPMLPADEINKRNQAFKQ